MIDPVKWAGQMAEPKELKKLRRLYPNIASVYESLCITIPGSVVISWQRREGFREECEELEQQLKEANDA
jgi:hypothetical protein